MILQPRPLHRVGLLAEFPAGKIEDGQSPEEAARMESKQEGGLVLCKPIQIGQPTMQFLHVIDETVYLYAALVKDQQAQELKDGEQFGGITLLWMPWDEFCNRIRIQESTGTPLIPDSPMDGVSLTSALKIMALGFNPEDLPEE
ncbi:MAG: NUDIX domain-containing protein [Clostridia bacterium]|nr:NUDIX domain-containing protein [Clostridia bacterium]